MKKLYFLFAVALFAFSASAQKAQTFTGMATPVKQKTFYNTDKSLVAVDTIGLEAVLQNANLYNIDRKYPLDSAYITGVNSIGNQIAVLYENSSSLQIGGVMFWIGQYQNCTAPLADIKVNVYGKGVAVVGDNGQQYTAGPGPDSDNILATGVYTPTLNDTAAAAPLSFLEFNTPAQVTDTFFVGVDFTAWLNSDTTFTYGNAAFGLVSSTVNSITPSNTFTFDKGFAAYLGAPLFVDASYWYGGFVSKAAIWPVVYDENTNIAEQTMFNGLKVQAYPNPASDLCVVEYALENASTNVTFEMYDLSGKVVVSKLEGSKTAGVHKFELNVNELPSGNYFYSIVTNNNRIVKRLVINN